MLCLDVHPGWLLLDRYPANGLVRIGSWLLFHNGEAALLEVPPDRQLIEDAMVGLNGLGVVAKYILVSSRDQDRFGSSVLRALRRRSEFKGATCIRSGGGRVGLRRLDLGGEPLWLIDAPVRSLSDRVVVFRGMAMTGAIDFGIRESSHGEVPASLRAKSLRFLADFEQMSGHRIQTKVNAYLGDYGQVEDWQSTVMHGGYPSLSAVPGLSSLRPEPMRYGSRWILPIPCSYLD